MKASKYQWAEDGLTCKAVVKGNVTKIKAVQGYCVDVETLLKLKDTGNGFIAKFPSYSSVEQDNYICINYADAGYLYKALQVYFEQHLKQ